MERALSSKRVTGAPLVWNVGAHQITFAHPLAISDPARQRFTHYY